MQLDTCIFDIWPKNVPVPAGTQAIITQTKSGGDDGCANPKNGHMDTSDVGPGGTNWSGHCTNSGVIPQVHLTIDGVTSVLDDTGQVLNTKGVD